MQAPVPDPATRGRIVRWMWVAIGFALFGVLALGLSLNARSPGQAVIAALVVVAVAVSVLFFVAVPLKKGGGLASPSVSMSGVWMPVEVPTKPPAPPIRACMRCGSRDVTIPSISDGVVVGGGELLFHVCRRCNTRAPPLEFDSGEDYVAFVRELHEEFRRGAGT